jgi:hypothetical protein
MKVCIFHITKQNRLHFKFGTILKHFFASCLFHLITSGQLSHITNKESIWKYIVNCWKSFFSIFLILFSQHVTVRHYVNPFCHFSYHKIVKNILVKTSLLRSMGYKFLGTNWLVINDFYLLLYISLKTFQLYHWITLLSWALVTIFGIAQNLTNIPEDC